MLKTDYFWTDRDQANERLSGSFILHNDNAVFIHEVRSARSGPKAVISRYPKGTGEDLDLSDTGFHRFRKPLPLGWVNNMSLKQACFLERRPVRSRQHGFSRNNVSVKTFPKGLVRLEQSREISFESVAKDSQYQAAILNDYPPLEIVLDKLKKDTVVAISPDMAIRRASNGVRWLCLNTDLVGLFVDNDTLLLIDEFTYVKEQLTENPLFTVSKIKEY